MTEEQQRIAIAEACGYKYLESYGWFDKDGETYYIGNEDIVSPQIPDYLNDLNAMHEAEKVLTADQWYKYDRLMPLRDPQKIHSPAAQRAEAFLRTIGKWTANPNEL